MGREASGFEVGMIHARRLAWQLWATRSQLAFPARLRCSNAKHHQAALPIHAPSIIQVPVPFPSSLVEKKGSAAFAASRRPCRYPVSVTATHK